MFYVQGIFFAKIGKQTKNLTNSKSKQNFRKHRLIKTLAQVISIPFVTIPFWLPLLTWHSSLVIIIYFLLLSLHQIRNNTKYLVKLTNKLMKQTVQIELENS